jgi:hypothetical protein
LPDCGTRILRVVHGRDARATFSVVLTVALASRSNLRFIPALDPEQKTGSASGLSQRRL